jgi:hypothetical protein
MEKKFMRALAAGKLSPQEVSKKIIFHSRLAMKMSWITQLTMAMIRRGFHFSRMNNSENLFTNS